MCLFIHLFVLDRLALFNDLVNIKALALARDGRNDKIDTLFDFADRICTLLLVCDKFAGHLETLLADLLDFHHALHCVQCLLHQVTIVFNWTIALLFEFESGVDCQFFPIGLTEGLCPTGFTWITAQFEVSETF